MASGAMLRGGVRAWTVTESAGLDSCPSLTTRVIVQTDSAEASGEMSSTGVAVFAFRRVACEPERIVHE